MKPFAFRLHSLGSIRRAERDACRTEFAAALAEQARLVDRRQALDHQLAAAQQRNREARSTGALTVETLIRGQQFEASLRTDLELLIRLQAISEAATARAQEALAIAERKVQVLEKLHERQLTAYQLEQNRAETRQLDEVAAGRFQREAA